MKFFIAPPWSLSHIHLAAALNSISRPSYDDAEFYFASAQWQRRILSCFGMAKYPSCGGAVCLNLTQLAMRQSVHLNSKRFTVRRYCKRRRAF